MPFISNFQRVSSVVLTCGVVIYRFVNYCDPALVIDPACQIPAMGIHLIASFIQITPSKVDAMIISSKGNKSPQLNNDGNNNIPHGYLRVDGKLAL